MLSGTPIFVARAVEEGHPIIPCVSRIPEVPKIPETYARHHPIRINSSLHADQALLKTPSDEMVEDRNRQWRHELVGDLHG